MGKRIVTLVALLVALGISSIYAQDPGIPDSLIFDSIKVVQGSKAVMNVYFYNDEELQGMSIPMHYSSPDVSIDSVSFVGSRVNYLANKPVNIDNANQQWLVGVIVFMESYIPAGRGLLCKVYFDIPSGISDQKIVADTMVYPPENYLQFVTVSMEVAVPVLTKGIIIVGNYSPPPTIGVNPDSLYFQAVAGGLLPDIQYLQINNIGEGTLNWTLTKKSSWLNLSPNHGTAPSTVQIFANSSGLPAGNYYDTIVVSDTKATNNPVLVPVKLKLIEPPPTIHLSQTNFNFNAIAGSTNPADQILTVTNTGYGVLQWTASNTGPWLSISPTSGTDLGTITLSVDIFGLAYGIYYDTVIVSDPLASNNPQIAIVKLQVASDLPVLAVDSPLIYVVVNTSLMDPDPPDRQFNIYNEGAGTMNYTLVENSSRIVSLTPSSGSVPQTVTAHFHVLHPNAGDEYYDTVQVISEEAVNSPKTVIFHFHCVNDPAYIALNRDSISISYHECSEGDSAIPRPPQLSVFNYGTDEMTVHLNYKSTWLILDETSGEAPLYVAVSFDYKRLSAGNYYDTISVWAINAINSPVKLPVFLHILPPSIAPEIEISVTDSVFLTAQENQPGKGINVELNNVNPGCMDWTIQNPLGWMTYFVDSSDVEMTYPWTIAFEPFANSISMGTYYGACQIVSNSASNSPVPINFRLQVWKLHGDVNWDGVINLIDLLYLIAAKYYDGPDAVPDPLVGDCNCDRKVDLLDILAIIDYKYYSHNPLCGNPY